MVLHKIPDVPGVVKATLLTEKIREEFFSLSDTHSSRYRPACPGLCINQVKEGIVHVEDEGREGIVKNTGFDFL